MSSAVFNRVSSRFRGVRPAGEDRRVALCPAHDDHVPSLSIRRGDRGVLLRCRAGCDTADVLRAVGLRFSDLFYNPPRPRSAAPPRAAPAPVPESLGGIDQAMLAAVFKVAAEDIAAMAAALACTLPGCRHFLPRSEFEQMSDSAFVERIRTLTRNHP